MPDILLKNIDLLINLVLAFITFSLGLNLTKNDFRNIFAFPKGLTVGLIAQMILLPLITFGLMIIAPFSPAVKVGFMIISFCPGGVTSNLVNYLMKANIALSISLTVINGILCMFTIPFLTNGTLDYFVNQSQIIELPLLSTIGHIALITAIPAAIGVTVRSKLPGIADTLRPILKYLLPALLLLIFTIKIFAPADNGGVALSRTELFDQVFWVLILNFSGMFVGFIVSWISGLDMPIRVTIMVEAGLHNTAMALYIGGNILQNADMQKPAIVHAMVTFVSTFLFAWLIKTITEKYFASK
jgi:BASS family bile acid:Na+ symporter